MNIILVLRSEIACAVILVMLLGYNIIYGCKSEKIFLRICLFALAHVIFDGITVFTVNNQELVGNAVNNIMHVMYLYSVIFFDCEIFCYILKSLISKAALRKFLVLARLPVIIYILAMPFLEIHYLDGNGTKYGAGSCVVAGYLLVASYTVIGIVLLIVNIRKVDKSITIGLLPCNIFVIICMCVQITVVEFLFTGAAVTLITMGLFFAIENPAAHYMKRAYIDIDTGIKNKNCYNEDMKRLNEEFFVAKENNGLFICAVCDINGLKAVNDHFGHIAGDELIRIAAEVLSKNLKSAYNVYRVGGDEFIAVFIGHNKYEVEKEIEDVRTDCGKYTNLKHPLSIAIGIANISDDKFESAYDVVSLADKRMYEDKVRMKKDNPAISVRD